MNDNQNLIRERVDEMLREVIRVAQPTSKKRSSSKALLAFLVRGACSWKSIRILADATESNVHDQHTVGNDCAAILRCMFDASIQAAFIFQDPEKRESLGQLYLDFEHVERYLLSQAIVKRDNPFSQGVARSPLRDAGEANNLKEFMRVMGDYERQGRGAKDEIRDYSQWAQCAQRNIFYGVIYLDAPF